MVLKAGGKCEVAIPEWLFDFDGPGHYMRRIKSVSVSLPSVAGPYSSVSCTLSLLKSTLRKSASVDPDYAREDSEDGRFVDYFGTIQSIVTSTGLNDSGMFETNLKEERLLPFEGAGVESTWRLELPAKFRQFDYDTISDVILHVRYTARQGGAALRDKAVEHLTAVVAEASTAGQALLLDLRHDFPTEWQQFVNGSANFEINLGKEQFPYMAQRRPDITIEAVELRAIAKDGKVKSLTPPGIALPALTQKLKDEGAFKLSLPSDNAVLKRDKDANAFVLIKYSL